MVNLNKQQLEAVEYLEGPLLVLAGPGTGKTQLLSNKVMYILNNTDASASNILCLTFTDTAAANMRERLKTYIGMEALKLNIGTYHAFGQEIMAQYKQYATDYDRRMDATIDDVMKYKIVRDIQKALPGNDILRGDQVSAIVETISKAKAAELTGDDLLEVANKNIEDSRVLSENLAPFLATAVPKKYQESVEACYGPVREILRAANTDLPIMKGVGRLSGPLAKSLEDAFEKAEEKKSISPLSEWRRKNFVLDDNGQYRLADRVANLKLLSLARVMMAYERYLNENGLFDFDDMIGEAVKALKSERGFCLTLQEKYQYILLDEFQDTNPAQFAIVKQLTDYEKPMVMAVGDDDQAIYEFQGALSSNMKDFCDHYGAKVVELTENYRSTQEILDYSTAVIMQADDRFKPDKSLHANRPAPKASEIYRYEFVAANEEYAFVADKIASLIKNGVRQTEIAVICRKKKYFDAFLPFLKEKEGVNIAYEKRDNLFEDEATHQILTIMKYVVTLANGKQDNAMLMEIMLYPCFGLPVVEVISEFDAARRERTLVLAKLAESKNMQIVAVAKFLAALSAREPLESVSVMLDFVTGARKLDDYVAPIMNYYTGEASELADYKTFVFYENLAALKGQIEKYFASLNRKIYAHDLVQMINDYEEAGMALTVKSPYRDADEAVQILTVHKSKGLEFDYVFIISMDNNGWGKSKGGNNLLSLPKNLQYIRHTGTTDSERLRLAYVAMTRARKTIFITNSEQDFTGNKRERLDYLKEYIDEGEIKSEILPSGVVEKVTLSGDIKERAQNIRSWLMRQLELSPDMRAYYKDKMKDFVVSSTALTTFFDIRYAGPEAFCRRFVVGLSEPESENIAFGNLIHATFEAVTKNQLDDDAAVEFFLNELKNYDADADTLRAMEEKGVPNLKLALNEFGNIIRSGEAEVKFPGQRIVVAGVPIRGKIDHLVVNEADKTIEVYDYKTGGFEDKGWTSEPKLFFQMLQLIFYKVLLNNSREYRNYRVTRGHMLYVVADADDGKVHQKSYDFNDKDEEMFRSLLVTIYNMALTLDFVNDMELFVKNDRNCSMKKIREYIALVLAKYGKQ